MTTATCPKCLDKVSIPAGASEKARTKCPLCQEEFELIEVLAKLPPTLIVVEDPGADALRAASEMSVSAAVGEPDSFSGIAEYRMADTDAESGGSSFEFAEAETPQSSRPELRPSTARSSRRQKNAAMEMVKIFGGGALGIGLAILIMWWGLGRDPFKLGPKISPYASFIVPAKFQGQTNKPLDDPASDLTGNTSNRAVDVAGSSRKRTGNRRLDDQVSKPSASQTAKRDNGKNKKPEPEENSVLLNLDSPELALEAEEALRVTKPSSDSESLDAPLEEPVGVLDAPVFTVDKLKTMLSDAKQNDVAWSKALQGEGDVGAKPGNTYKALARLAEAVTFVDEKDPNATNVLPDVADLLLGIGKETSKLSFVTTAAGMWMQQAERRPSNGILIYGSVGELRQVGSLYETTVVTEDSKKSMITVVTKLDPQKSYQKGDRLLVLGSIVDAPSINLAGYEGNETIVVYGGYPVVLPE